jgi:hypothetical protein
MNFSVQILEIIFQFISRTVIWLNIFDRFYPVVSQPPYTVEKSGTAFHPLFTPFQVFYRRCCKKAKQSGCVCSVLFKQGFRVYDIFFRFGHFFNPADNNRTAAYAAYRFFLFPVYLIRQQELMFRAFCSFFTDHTLGQQFGKRFFAVYESQFI